MVIYESVKGTLFAPIHRFAEEWETLQYDFTEKDIVKDSCSITSCCCDDQTFSIGGVRPAELSIKLNLEGLEDVNAFTMYGAKIVLWSKYALPDDESKPWILRGEFWVTSVKRSKSFFTLKASDALIWLDVDCYISSSNGGEQTKDGGYDGTIYRFFGGRTFALSYASNEIIGKYVNQKLEAGNNDQIFFATRDDIVNERAGTSGSYVLPHENDVANYTNISPRDIMKSLAEVAAGCVQMIPTTRYSSEDIEGDYAPAVFITPFGYAL